MTSDAAYRLVIVSPEEPERTVPLVTPLVQIGRDSTRADLVLAHGWVSRSHARIYCDREPYRVEDVGSSNGTMLNDLPLVPHEPRPLKPGDVIAIGPFRLTFEAVAGVTPAVPEPPDREVAEPAAPEPPLPESPVAETAASPEPEAAGMAVLERLATRRVRPEEVGPSEPPPEPPAATAGPAPTERWVGMPAQASRWLQYLPPIYADGDFLGRYLLLFEDLLGPIQQIIAHWDLFLDPDTAPEAFLPWLNDWMAHPVDERWSPATQRVMLRQVAWLHQARGTAKGLQTHLEIATGCPVQIEEFSDGPHTFRVTVQAGDREVDRRVVERIVELNRPAHTGYSVQIA